MTLTPKMLLPPPLLLLLLLLLQTGSELVPPYPLTVQESVTVLEGANVHVPCNFFYPQKYWHNNAPAYGYWFREGVKVQQDAPVATNDQRGAMRKKTQGRFRLLGDPKNYNCSLEIRDAWRNDTGTYFFRVEKGNFLKYSYKENQLYLCVTALSQTPDINIQRTLESGHPRNITCTVSWACKRGTPLTFSWIGVNLNPLGPWTPHSSVVTLTPGPQHHDTNLTCQVTFHGGVSTERTIQLNVSYAPQDLTISVFRKECTGREALGNGSSLLVQEGDSLRLLCVTHSNPPASLSWAQGGQTLHRFQPSDPGVLELPQIQREHEGEFTCHAQNPLGSQKASLSLSVVGKSRSLAGVVPGALGGAGAMALLSLCLCLIFFCIPKARRKRAAGGPKGKDDEDPVMDTVSWVSDGSKHKPCPDIPLDQAPPAEESPLPGGQQDVYYANVTFLGRKSQEPWGQEATSTTEYSEVNRSK
uniref:Ig-like domain-containing protein n=1 Tax=Rousettus aegyptiacus TaxID=9407 RepID=A0A7J8CLI1_ROUAE|nr:hypothetical protein HJG63_017595 [Rousettus aegyptiacus]